MHSSVAHCFCVIRLECESGYFFNMNYFEECVTKGDWDEVENYLSGFTEFNDDRYSAKIFFDIRKQKYLEALDRYITNPTYMLSVLWRVLPEHFFIKTFLLAARISPKPWRFL